MENHSSLVKWFIELNVKIKLVSTLFNEEKFENKVMFTLNLIDPL